MTQYTESEMHARVAALANVHIISDLEALIASDHPTAASAYAAPALPGKVMESRYAGRCADCGGVIVAGTTIRYDGKARHYPACSVSDPTDPRVISSEASDRYPLESAYVAEPYEGDTPAALRDGKWTLQYSDGHHRTFKIHTQKADATFAPGKRVIKYLAKSDNMDEASYVGFAFYVDGVVMVWKKFAGSVLAGEAALLNDVEAARRAGKAYAMASGRCYRCGHELTDPDSIQRGLGPDCAKM